MKGGSSTTSFVLLFYVMAVVALAQPFDYPTAKPGTVWTNAPNAPHTIPYTDGTIIKAILLRGVPPPVFIGPTFAAGFYCRSTSVSDTMATPPCRSNFLFGVFVVYTNSGAGITMTTLGVAQVVWSANRDRPVGENATLHLTTAGDLVLKDADGTVAWSTGTAGKGVAGISIGQDGNLVLANTARKPVWQSFDHPTDTLVPGQKLPQGSRLTANVSQALYTGHGKLYLEATSVGFSSYVEANPPQRYYDFVGTSGQTPPTSGNYMLFTNGSFTYYMGGKPASTIPLPALPFGATSQYLRLESDGHLRLYQWPASQGWRPVADAMTMFPPSDPCRYPTVCGSYGICSDGQCSCPTVKSNPIRVNPTYFLPINPRKPNLGCRSLKAVQCSAFRLHKMLPFKDLAYFDKALQAAAGIKSAAACSDACLKQCSCKAAFYQYGIDPKFGSCYLVPQVFTLIDHVPDVMHFNSTGFIKVQL